MYLPFYLQSVQECGLLTFCFLLQQKTLDAQRPGVKITDTRLKESSLRKNRSLFVTRVPPAAVILTDEETTGRTRWVRRALYLFLNDATSFSSGIIVVHLVNFKMTIQLIARPYSTVFENFVTPKFHFDSFWKDPSWVFDCAISEGVACQQSSRCKPSVVNR